MRDGASNQQMWNVEVEELFYAAGRLHFDRKPCVDFSMENDLDDETWARFSRRAKVPDAMDRMVALRNLGLLDGEDRMTHAGAWLLARDIRRFTTSAHVSCALFMGAEKVRILDRRDFHEDVPTTVDDAVAWILAKINVEFIIKGVRRQERPELPEEALREAVANAVAHRDYRSTANVPDLRLQGPDRGRQPGRVAGGNDGAGPGHEEHAPESPVVRHVVPDGRGREHRVRNQAYSRSLPRPRGGGTDHRRVRTLGDGDLFETGRACRRAGCPRRRRRSSRVGVEARIRARVSGCRARVSGCRARVSGCRARVSGCRARVSGCRARVDGRRAEVPGAARPGFAGSGVPLTVRDS